MKAEIENRLTGNDATRFNIMTSLLEMMKEKPFSAISISELCQKADISRMTFYRNYKSTEEVISEQLKCIMAEYWYRDFVNLDCEKYWDKIHLKLCFSYFYEYREFLESIIKCGLGDMFYNYLTEYVIRKWCVKDTEMERFEAIAFSGILYNILKRWMQEEYVTSIDNLAETASEMCEKGLMHVNNM